MDLQRGITNIKENIRMNCVKCGLDRDISNMLDLTNGTYVCFTCIAKFITEWAEEFD